MNGVIRSWACLNARCNNQFQSWDSNPECPKCRCVRVSWIPGGGHVAGTARAADADLRTLADNYGLTDLASARRGERAKPSINQPSAPVASRHDAMQFGPGFAARPYVIDRGGRVHPVCEPSMQKVNFKTKLGAEIPLGPGKLGHAPISSNTKIEASHRR
jgi:hypothetical protein